MTRSFKIAAVTATVAGMAAPALAHVGDHGAANSSHWLVEHGLAAAIIATVVIAGVAFYLRNKA